MEKEKLVTTIPVKKPRATKKPKGIKPEHVKRVVLPVTRVVKRIETIKGAFGEFECTNYIPYEEKVELAIQIVNRSVMLDEPSGWGHSSMNKAAEVTLGIVQGYTNIDVPEEGRYDFYAYLIASQLTDALWEVVYPDAWILEEIVKSIRETAIARFNHMNSIDHYFKEMSSGTQAGDDLLNLLNAASTNQNKVATNITTKIDELQRQAANPIINLSKRKSE